MFTLLDSKYNNPDTKNTCTGEDENPLDEDKQKLINDILNLVGQLKTLKDDKVDEAKIKKISELITQFKQKSIFRDLL